MVLVFNVYDLGVGLDLNNLLNINITYNQVTLIYNRRKLMRQETHEQMR